MTSPIENNVQPTIIIKTEKSESRLWKNVFRDCSLQLMEECQFIEGPTGKMNPNRQEVVKIFGKEYRPHRYRHYQGDSGVSYRYSGISRKTDPWTPYVLAIKNEVERLTEQSYNFALINYYPDGKSKLGWHSDDERDIIPGSTIASVSLGTTRDFQIREKSTDKTKTIPLENGDLLTMEGDFQKEFKHQIPARMKVKTGRINITFRLIQ